MKKTANSAKKSPAARAATKQSGARRAARRPAESDEMRPEYDFRGGVRGKYVERLKGGSNVVVLDPDVAAAFPSPEAVNSTLRALAKLIREQAQRGSRHRTA